jgi:hypothetical protein
MNRRWLGSVLTGGLQRTLFLGTVLVVWLFHRAAIKRGGMSLIGWWRCCWREFDEAFALTPGLAALPGESW